MFILSNEEYQKVNYIVGLVVFAGPSINLSILVDEQENNIYLPACPIKESSIQDAAKLLFDLTNVSAKTGMGTTGFVNLTLCGIHDNPSNKINGERSVYIIYGVNLPQKPEGKFLSLNDKRISQEMLEFILTMGRKL